MKMKTHLLALVMVAFLYLEPGYTLRCHSCVGYVCKEFEFCKPEQKQCIYLINRKKYSGCSRNCPSAGANELVKCCATDRCNLEIFCW
nr:three finger toxin 3 [Protobothrops flavoviridis]